MDKSSAAVELEKAYLIRQKGNEGMSRVLARRAAGLAIREYLVNKDIDLKGRSLNTLLKDVDVRKMIPLQAHEALDRLSMRIGMDFSFPVYIDLLSDAKTVIELLSTVTGEIK